MNRPSNRWTLAVAAGIAAVVTAPVALAAAGKVLAVSGSVWLAGSHPRELKAGDTIEAGQLIATREGSNAQLLMADGSRLDVRANSQMRVDEMVLASDVEHPGASASVGRTVSSLLSGGVTVQSTAFAGAGAVRELRTPYGTLTVSGSRYSAEICRNECEDYPGRTGVRVAVDDRTEFVAEGGVILSAPDSLRAPDVVQRSIEAKSLLGRPVDLIDTDLPYTSRISAAILVPVSGSNQIALSSTELSDMQSFNSGGNLVQFNAPFGDDLADVSAATYLAGTAVLLDSGSNGSSGIRWGRWTGGAAQVSTVSGSTSLNLSDGSLHWIAGPVFEAAPVIPTSGVSYFVLSGGTSPTDDSGHVGSLVAATLQANFTTQQVNAALSLNVNGYNWYATGTGSLVSGTPRFNGTFDSVLIDGRILGKGAYSGFLSAGALSSDQLNGAGISYWLTDSSGQLGTVYGVVAYVPGSPTAIPSPVVYRDVAYAIGKIDASQTAGGVAANSREQLAVNSSLAVTRFSAPVPHASLGTLASGVSQVVDNGQSTATGIRWGRWSGGAIDVTTPPHSSQSNDISTQSLHWIAGNEYATAPTLPLTGAATYTLVGNTSPTDTLSHIGTLGSASFNADFTNRLITSVLTLNVNGTDWYAKGNATYNVGEHTFEGTYDDVRVQNLVRGQGTIYGFFTQPRASGATSAGAGLSFNLTENTRELGVISGVIAFVQGGAGATVTPQAQQARDISIDGQTARVAPGEYELDNNFSLSSSTLGSLKYDIGTSSVGESDVSPLVMLRWGRWSGGSANVTDLVASTIQSLDLSQRSLHWIEGADSSSPPVMPTSGTATYTLIGGTSPTDRAGHVGTLNGASLNANFTTQQVAASLDVTVNNVNVVATGNGSIGAALGLQSHQFAGSINGGAVSNSAVTPQGSFSGFFTTGGAGLTYTLDGQSIVIDGAAAFRKP